MATHLANSQLCTTSTHHSHKAWHLLSLLLPIGRPTRSAELASKCTLFRATPELVEFLCSIPNSPLFLTRDFFVTISFAASVSFARFASNVNSIIAFVPRIGIRVRGPRRLLDDISRTYFRKRKRLIPYCEVMAVVKKRVALGSVFEDQLLSMKRIQNAGIKEHFRIADDTMNTMSVDMSVMAFDSRNLNNVMAVAPLFVNSNSGVSSYESNTAHIEDAKVPNIYVRRKMDGDICTPECQQSFLKIESCPNMPEPVTGERIIVCEPIPEPPLLTNTLENKIVRKQGNMDGTNLRSQINFYSSSCLEVEGQSNISPVEAGNGHHACKPTDVRIIQNERIMKDREGELLIDSSMRKGEIDNLIPPYSIARLDISSKNDFRTMNLVIRNDAVPSLEGEATTVHADSRAIFPAAELFVAQKQMTKSSVKLKAIHADALTPELQAQSSACNKSANAAKEQQHCRRDRKSTSMKRKMKRNHNNTCTAEKRENPMPISSNNQLQPKVLPKFESFIVEEEEGSGGYGTVYRALRKNDRITVAIKCPHTNAPRHHVNNEKRMLEQFGGKNFVIKFEGSFKSGNSDCFVLQHVEHDRPEVLKREIDLLQLHWYGYCMFRALASLHKQGVVHRDVKPGNFLFSRKINKGYLIDFNLALDLHQKYGTLNKSSERYDVKFDPVTLARAKFVPFTKNEKFPSAQSLQAVNKKTAKDTKTLELRNLKRKAVAQTKFYADLDNWNTIKSQGADRSGITSVKDVTSTRTTSAERLREPVPCQGRKELISLVQEALQSPDHKTVSVPASKRKRVAALPGKVDKKLDYRTPMPLHSAGIAVAGDGLLKNNGDGKHKREGPCVGTKGFRAPEVLFRSRHQGPKVDIWSAGVTLLYLMIGRTPFTGDPEQNIKEIAKLKGSEDLWEVAKLHNRESSFPQDLLDIRCLPFMRLREWCKVNTKRPEFLDVIPRSLFDLVDKCLTVNPRLRISAEEALRHEFFAPCHESLRKQSLPRDGSNLDSRTSHVSRGPTVIRPVKDSHDQV